MIEEINNWTETGPLAMAMGFEKMQHAPKEEVL